MSINNTTTGILLACLLGIAAWAIIIFVAVHT